MFEAIEQYYMRLAVQAPFKIHGAEIKKEKLSMQRDKTHKGKCMNTCSVVALRVPTKRASLLHLDHGYLTCLPGKQHDVLKLKSKAFY